MMGSISRRLRWSCRAVRHDLPTNNNSTPSTKSMVAMEGYFITRGHAEQQVMLESRRWDRQYFVLFCTAEFYVYKSRQNCRSDPKAPLPGAVIGLLLGDKQHGPRIAQRF